MYEIEGEILRLIKRVDFGYTHQYYTVNNTIYYSISGIVTRDAKFQKEFDIAVSNLVKDGFITEIESKYEGTRMFRSVVTDG